MTSFVTLLRAVNVGGNRVPMADLRALLEDLGLQHVRTYLQSGNAVFASGDASPAALGEVIEQRIERDLGPRVGALVLPAGSLRDVIAANPFADRDAADEGHLHATFLFPGTAEAEFGPATEADYSAAYRQTFERLDLPAAEGEEAVFVGCPPLVVPVIYLRLPHGYGRSKLSNAYFEGRLGASATTRNWRTVVALAQMAEEF